jgi:hypothetical protein
MLEVLEKPTIESNAPAALTPAQKAQQEKRNKRGASADPNASEPAEITPLPVMLGEGRRVIIGATAYEVSGFPIKRMAQAGKLLAEVPDLLVTAALAGAESGEASLEALEARVQSLLLASGQEATAAVSGEYLGTASAALVTNISEAQAQAMLDLTLLALYRLHPEITPADIENDLDIPTFLAVLMRIFRANDALRKRF